MYKNYIILIFLIIIYGYSHAQDYNMDNTAVSTCSGYFYDSQGSTTFNVGGLGFCTWQGTYENNENFTKTFCSNNGQNLSFNFDLIELKGTDYLNIYDGNSTAAPLIANLTSANTSGQFVSSGTCLTFEFRSFNNGTSMWCDKGGNWSASISCVTIYEIDQPGQVTTCDGFFTDDGGMTANYSPNANFTKTFCPDQWNCVKLNFSELNLGAGDQLSFYNGTSAVGAPFMTLNSASPIPPLGVSSGDGQCLTIKFTSDGTTEGTGWLASIFCPPNCGTPPNCASNPAADNQCTNATPICNLEGFCGNTSSTYNSIDHLGNDWDNVSGLMDDFCGSVENNSWLSFVAEENTATLNVWTLNCQNNQGIQMQIYATSDCQDFAPHSNCVSVGTPTDFVIQAFDLVPGQTYYLMIDGFAGDVCDYIISAGNGIALGAQITPEQTICLGNTANVTLDGVSSTGATFTWSSVPVDPTMVSYGNYIIAQPTVTTEYFVNVVGTSANPLCGPINETFNTIVNVIDDTNPACQENVDCQISATSDVTEICEGDPVTLSATGNISISLLANDFDSGEVGVGWASTTAATFSNPCGPGPDGSTCLWMGSVSPAPRNLTSIDFDVSAGGVIMFYLRYAIQGDASPCEGPDEPDEGITLQYSTNYGVSFTNIGYFNPSSVAIEPANPFTNTPSITGPTAFTSWAQYSFPIPPAAQTANTRFRWIQEASTDLTYDHWGLDSIFIGTPPPGVVINWTSNPPGLVYTGNNPPVQYPSQTITYYATIVDSTGVHTCVDSVIVIVNPNPSPEFSVDSVDCFENSTTVTFLGNSSPTTIFTWNFNGGIAVPGTGIGPHTVNWNTSGNKTIDLNVNDTGGCSSDTSVTLFIPQQLLIDSVVKTNVLCYGDNTGSLNIYATGGTGQLQYSISGPIQYNGTFNNLIAGNYSVTVTDANNCSKTSSVTISQPTASLSLTTSSNDSICAGASKNIFAAASGGTAPYSFEWKDPSGTVVGNTNSIIVNPTVTTTYSVILTDANGCTAGPKYVTVYVSPFINLTLVKENVKCKSQCNGKATLTVTGGVQPYTYSWPSGTNVNPNLCAGNYNVTVTDAWGCWKDTVFTITEPTALSYTTSMKQTKCYGSYDGVARVNASGGTSPYTYNWSTGGSYTDSLVTGQGTYQVTVTDANFCTITATITITQPSQVTLSPPSNQTICIGQPASLTATGWGGTGNLSFVWYNATMGSYTGATLNVSPTTTQVYHVYAQDINGCRSASTAAVTVFVYPKITADFIADKTTICPGDTINIQASISGGNGGPYTCTLQDGRIVIPPFKLVPEGSDTTITYTITVNDFCNSPAGVDQITVNLLPIPPIDITADTLVGCQPFTVNFSELTPSQGQTYLWNFNDGDFNTYSYSKNPKHTFEEAGVYDVELTVTSLNGCKNTILIEDMITVNKNPFANFVPEPSVQSIIKPIFYFENLSSNTYSCFWNFGDGNISSDVNPTHKYNGLGVFNVELIIVNEKGCKDTAVLPVIVKDEYTFFAPTAFSPGNDGTNDVFYVWGKGIDPENYHLLIYDRWGEIIFETYNYDPLNPKSTGWDGRVKGGKIAEIGTYTWYVLYKDLGGVERQEAGPITIVR